MLSFPHPLILGCGRKILVKQSCSKSVEMGNTAYLTFAVERYVPATGGMKTVMAQDSVRVLGVDIDLDKNAAICTVLETDAKGHTVEVARHFVKQPSLVKRRKRDLGQIARRMKATGITHKGFCKKWWERLHNREVEMGRAIARQIVNLAHGYGCQVIVLEHLGNRLRPIQRKVSWRLAIGRFTLNLSKAFESIFQVKGFWLRAGSLDF